MQNQKNIIYRKQLIETIFLTIYFKIKSQSRYIFLTSAILMYPRKKNKIKIFTLLNFIAKLHQNLNEGPEEPEDGLPRHGSSTTKIKAWLSHPREIPPRREVSISLFLVSRGRVLLVKLINNASVGSSASWHEVTIAGSR